jgi:rhomboid protease GluP
MNMTNSSPVAATRSQPWYRSISLTAWIVLLNCLVYAGMGFPLKGSHTKAMEWGASWPPFTLGGQWWRLFTSLFIHISLGHLVGNMFILWLVGRRLEKVFPRSVYIAIYLLSGLAGGVCSLSLHPDDISNGASAAIFGVVTALLATWLLDREARIRRRGKVILFLLTCMLTLNLYFGNSGVDTAAHVVGAAIGLLLGVLLSRGEKSVFNIRRIVIGTSVIILTALLAVRIQNSWVLPLGTGTNELRANHYQQAEAEFQRVLRQHPNDVFTNITLGELYSRQNRLSEAESLLKRALAVDPTNEKAEIALGFVYLQEDRFHDAQGCVTRLLANRHIGPDVQELFAGALAGEGDFALAGHQYLKLKMYDEAIDNLRKALNKTPSNKDVVHELAEAYRAKGMTAEAEAVEKGVATQNAKPPIRAVGR